VNLGIILGDVDVATSPRDHLDHLLRQVDAAQSAGIRHLTIGQHFLYDGQRWLQPVPTLARLAAEVDRDTRLVTTVLLAPLYSPVLLAEELATLDVVSEGRLVAGFGLGYRQVEYANFGVPFAERAGRFDEALSVIEQMWTKDHVDHDGRWFHVHGPVHVRPWQDPRPPIWIGADGPAGVRRAAQRADAWIIGPTKQPNQIGSLLAEFDARRDELGLKSAVHPIRRDIAVGSDRATALRRFMEQTESRYRSYVQNERADYGPPDAQTLAARLLHGTIEDCASQARQLAERFPVDPIIVRPDWPGMTTDEVVCSIAGLADLATALAEVPVSAPS
jgi:alkanesulfonate monooxygenase SsuD/methylene tetrahydromethanopterin reductase-like flavin-dependent oxidoreductase (luciferase family)